MIVAPYHWRMVQALLLALLVLSIAGCERYDYYPRGIHVYIQKIPGVDKGATTHTVKKGETLSLIARSYGVKYQDIAKLNGLKKPYTIFIGQKLVIRGSRASAGSKPNKPPSASTKSPTVAAPSIKNFKLIWPVQGRFSSKFGPRKGRMHDGIDIAAKIGTRIVAAASGEVVYADNKLTGYGNLIIIRHNSKMFTAYAHNDRNLVARGDKVKQGQRIATVGETGRVTGPHVHFELRKGETAIDPLPYLPKR
ncbi:MAG TPA: M23 family metallopeptidase [Ghiorsea sp.]|nr:M23 family metallopeptidase [Ghiorsea sp.]HIP07590.1 M23 family metallopeptidase [Mariprofundaceae bacterium]